MSIKKRFSIPASIVCLALAGQSFSAISAWDNLFSSWVVGVSGGPVWQNPTDTQTFYLQPSIKNTYTSDSQNNLLAAGELFLGIQSQLKYHLSGQLGVSVAATNFAKMSGQVWQDADPEFNNFVYQWQTQNTRVSLTGKLIKDNAFYDLSPYVKASLGAGFNRASEYQSSPIIFQALPEPNFNPHTTTSFAYSVGVGIQHALNAHAQLGVGYEFADWGKTSLARASGQTMGSGLSINHFYTNGLMFALTYLA